MFKNTIVYRIMPDSIDNSLIEEICGILRNNGLIAFPTETVYGLGALISKVDAIKKIFIVKGRPIDNPLIVHVSSIDMFIELVENIPDRIIRLVEKLWPGPFTIIWWKKSIVPDEVTAGLPKVAIRMPAHPVALELIRVCGEAIAAPSANRSGKPSPTNAEHVISDLFGLIDAVIDSGETIYGVESTIIDFTTNPPRLLRPGALPVEDIISLIGESIEIPLFARGYCEAEYAEAPGMRYRHYAPNSFLTVVETDEYSSGLRNVVKKIREIVELNKNRFSRLAIICSSETCSEYVDLGVRIYDIGSRSNLFIVARNLFKTLRQLDSDNIEFAVAEGFEEKGLGLTIMNRLRKASGFNIVKT
ncbi:MAG: L-threonylcarbamoyladenylate synthase [Desulfurococcaceae archaeon]